MDFKTEIASVLNQMIDLPIGEIQALLEVPPQREMGDFALPCFKLAKTLRQSPIQIAQQLSALFSPLPACLTHVQVQGGYLNFFINRSLLIAKVMEKWMGVSEDPAVVRLRDVSDKTWIGSAPGTDREAVLVEYSSPNIAKPFHIGHGFTTILGESLARIHSFLGERVLRLNHLGDYGTQFGKLIVAYRLWCHEEALEATPIQELLRLYVKFHDEAKKEMDAAGKSALEEDAREAFKQLEAGDPESVSLWQRFRDLSLAEFNRVYERLGIVFDNTNGESFYSPHIPDVVASLTEKGLLEESEGALVVRLDEDNLPPCLVLKSDGSTIYASRDLAAICYREETWHFKDNIYVVGQPQSLHFQQIFGVLKKAGVDCAQYCRHVPFGTVKFPDGAFSTRKGNIIKLEDLLDEAVAKTRQIIVQNAADRQEVMADADVDAIAEKVGLGAIVHLFLKSNRERDIEFRWENVLDFEGDTAPYLQYTYARARSILRKAEVLPGQMDASLIKLEALTSEQAYQTLREMSTLDESILEAARYDEPSILTRKLSQIARQFNRFYSTDPILSESDSEAKNARLMLCHLLCQTLRTGLYLLGIPVVEKM